MAIAKKLRFNNRNIKVDLKIPIIPFPPEKFSFEDLNLHFLCESNKTDLVPSEDECDFDISRAGLEGNLGQYTYTSDVGDIYEAYIYLVQKEKKVILLSLRTRLK